MPQLNPDQAAEEELRQVEDAAAARRIRLASEMHVATGGLSLDDLDALVQHLACQKLRADDPLARVSIWARNQIRDRRVMPSRYKSLTDTAEREGKLAQYSNLATARGLKTLPKPAPERLRIGGKLAAECDANDILTMLGLG